MTEVTADEALYGGHSFSYILPDQYRDALPHQIYAYVVFQSMDYLISGSGQTFYSYLPTAAGQSYYTNTLLPLLQNECSSCHIPSYQVHYVNLVNPGPNQGGSAINNQLINMATGGHMGQNHPGSDLCGNKNNSPCSEMQTWWNLEFP